MKIIYGALIKNPKRKTAPYYGRVRQDGKERYESQEPHPRRVSSA